MDVQLFIKENLQKVFKEEYDLKLDMSEIHVEHPNNESWGDYATNICMIVSKRINQFPIEIAKNVSYRISNSNDLFTVPKKDINPIEKVTFETPGFINFTLSHNWLLEQLGDTSYLLENKESFSDMGHFRTKKVLFEYTDPNPFKAFHIGHLMTNTIGESLSRLYEFLGAEVKRANYQGDVGMHVAKSIWGFIHKLESEKTTLDELEKKELKERVKFMGEAYAFGATKFKEDEDAASEMKDLNALIYLVSQERLIEEENWEAVVDYEKFVPENIKFDKNLVKEIYIKGRKWSLEDFEDLYKKLGTKFDYYFFESQVGEYGWQTVSQYLEKGIFEQDQGAVIFRGENYDLHNRVFLNSNNLPTYEAKDLGLSVMKYDNYKYDKSFIVTGNEINDYFRVVLKALENINPELAQKTVHIGHGMLQLSTGKMSSRTGNVVTGVTLIEDAKETILEKVEASDNGMTSEEREEVSSQLGIGSVKYSILKNGIGKNIIYDKEKSLEVTGNTGVYLQYTHARANSVLTSAPEWEYDFSVVSHYIENGQLELEEKEVILLRHLSKFIDYVILAADDLAPSTVCTYLFELASHFNTFYNDFSILGAENEMQRNFRLMLTKQVKDVLKTGLWLLGINAPDRV